MSKKALGKGLGAILKEAYNEEIHIHNIPISDIYPDSEQPRKDFNEKSLRDLSVSIESNGIIQPILVSKEGEERYSIIAGERRWRASKLAKLEEIPCIIRSIVKEKRLEIALVENLQREDLNPIEEAEAYRFLIKKFGFTQEDTAAKIGKDRSTIANMLRLLKLPPAIHDRLRSGDLSVGHARALITLENDNLKLDLCDKIIKKGLSVRQTESVVKKLKSPSSKKEQDSTFAEKEGDLVNALSTRVVITGKKKGSIKIFFSSSEELNKLIDIIKGK